MLFYQILFQKELFFFSISYNPWVSNEPCISCCEQLRKGFIKWAHTSKISTTTFHAASVRAFGLYRDMYKDEDIKPIPVNPKPVVPVKYYRELTKINLKQEQLKLTKYKNI